LVLIGTSMIIGDGILTPAISGAYKQVTFDMKFCFKFLVLSCDLCYMYMS
jgi:hypothetical protein